MNAPNLEGRVRGLGREGDAVIETARGIVFADGGVPGDRVRLVGVRKEGKVLRARRLVVLEPSPDRIESPCAYLERCGGCPWMTVSARAQLEIKRETVARALARLGAPPISIFAPRARLGYRRRARLVWKKIGQGVALGYRARRGDRIADVERCVVLRPELEAALAILRARVIPHAAGEGTLQLAIGEGGRAVVALESEDAPPRAFFAAIEDQVREGAIAGASVRAGGASAATILGDPREHGSDCEGRPLLGPIGGFSQAHEEVNAILGARVIELAEAAGARVLELHAGHGNLTLALAARAALVRAVELSPAATQALRANLAAHELCARVEVITGDASLSIPNGRIENGGVETLRIDTVVLDPPRVGAKDAMPAIARLRPAIVVYVSCDPATLARDLGILAAEGYRLDHAEALDMFPQTAHVETIARMLRAAPAEAGKRRGAHG